MIVYFSIYCFIGYCLESLYVSLLQRKWISSGLLKGPFIPLYGIGGCLLVILYPFLSTHPLISFFIGGLVVTSLELFASYFIECYFHTKCWDYKNHFLNFQGRICLLYFIIWCFLSYVVITFFQPYLFNKHIVNDMTYILSLIYIIFILRALIEKQKKGLDI